MSCCEGEKSRRTKTTPSLGDFLVCHGHGVFHGCLSRGCGDWLVNHPVVTPGTRIGRELLRVCTRQAPVSTKRHTLQFRQRLRHGTI